MKKLDNRIKKFVKDAKKEILTDEYIQDAHLHDLGALFGEYLCDEEEGKVFIKAKEKFDRETDKKIDLLIKKHFEELR
jgi:replicative superfamily II helicase|tara:strand:- start:79 stop:312 length:234 start_codon:yes stop_codon:yes gene_type:complete